MPVKCFAIILLSGIVTFSLVVSIIAITQTIKAALITTADIDNYNPALSSSFTGVKQQKPPTLHNTTKTTATAATRNSILITTTTTMPPQTLLMPAAEELMSMALTAEMPISETKRKTPLQKQYQQQQRQQQQTHCKYTAYTADNKHPPCADEEHAASSIVSENISSIDIGIGRGSGGGGIGTSNHLKSPRIGATAKGHKPLRVSTSNSVDIGVGNNGGDDSSDSGSDAAFSSSSTTRTEPMPMPAETAATAFNVARNGFRDKINISNQRNEFSNVDDDSNYNSNEPSDDAGAEAVLVAKVQQQYRRSRTAATTTATSNEAESSFFERAELLESDLSPDEHRELLLHRRKRYLVFPEGSSFQLVFDLIIGIVDYTSYAILGITCSVAWELPSKPPSEIVENFRDKLNEGSFGLQRRNDSTAGDGAGAQLQYVDTSSNNKGKYNSSAAARKTAASTEFANFENNESAWKPQLTVPNSYHNNNKPSSGSGSGSYYKTAADTSGPSRRVDGFANAGGDNFDAATQRKTLSEKEPSPAPTPPMPTTSASTLQQSGWHRNYAKLNTNTKYYNNNKNYYKNVWNFDDKQKYAADWYQQRQRHHHQQQQQELHASSSGSSSSNADRFSDNVDASANDDYTPDSFGAYQGEQQTSYAGPWQQKHNWWQRNKQRLQAKWQRQQQAWATYAHKSDEPTWSGYAPKRPITDYARPLYNNNANTFAYERTGRERKMLTSPPKHRIYPVFGRRRRRSLTHEERPLTAFEVEMERVHFREQLETRQKLFGKIEQVFKTRGHNGTECVLRALCETGQRQPHHQHHQQSEQQLFYHRRPRHQRSTATGQHREPQSFIAELLRAVFALPKDIADRNAHSLGLDAGLELQLQRHQQREFEAQMPSHYRAAHTFDGNCALRFAGCELSIWDDDEDEDEDEDGIGSAFPNAADAGPEAEVQAEAAATGRRHTFQM